jgi:bacteriorhodopsin
MKKIKKTHLLFLPVYLVCIVTGVIIIGSYAQTGDALFFVGFLPLFSSAIPVVIALNMKRGDK